MTSKQKIFCNACGKELFVKYHGSLELVGREFKVCSSACLREIHWRDTLSIMGSDYYPDPEPYKEPK